MLKACTVFCWVKEGEPGLLCFLIGGLVQVFYSCDLRVALSLLLKLSRTLAIGTIPGS